jgi:hypothetical protein
LQAVFAIKCEKPEHAKLLLAKLGMPFDRPAQPATNKKEAK